VRTLHFDNRWVHELPGDLAATSEPRQVRGAAWSTVAPTPVAAPRLLAWSAEVAASLDFTAGDLNSSELLAALSGNGTLPGMQTYSTCYGGHQFGHWAGQLGDGRAIGLGELINQRGERWELQLKGAGRTPYSRMADGRAVLRSSVREFLCSEAMHHLGIPTTRALSLVATGEAVLRDMFYDGNARTEPGAIVCRVSPTFTRFGHFEIFASRGEHALLAQLVEFTIDRDFPEIRSSGDARLSEWLTAVGARTARLIVEWMRVGFVHGVMNTDNMSIAGLTIDYGPYGWLENFDPGWTPNTTDATGRRYCYGRQAAIARWNLERLVQALAALKWPAGVLSEATDAFDAEYERRMPAMLAQKFGWAAWRPEDAALVTEIFDLMQRAEVDMTEFFRALAGVDLSAPDASLLSGAFYRDALRDAEQGSLAGWLQRYALRGLADQLPEAERAARMNAVNPRFVLRNYLAQLAIDAAEQGDITLLETTLDVMRHPYEEQPGRESYAALRPDWARHKPGCSMLSCSS